MSWSLSINNILKVTVLVSQKGHFYFKNMDLVNVDGITGVPVFTVQMLNACFVRGVLKGFDADFVSVHACGMNQLHGSTHDTQAIEWHTLSGWKEAAFIHLNFLSISNKLSSNHSNAQAR